MENHKQTILALCQEIHAEGLTPSVALVRARSSVSLPLPEVVSVLQRWKAGCKERQGSDMSDTCDANTAILDAVPHSLESRVASLERKVAELIDKIDALST